jgi:hypothetical protein
MTELLRPMSTGELMDRTFALYRKHFKLFVGIATLGPAANLIFQLLILGSVGIPAANTPRTDVLSAASVGLSMLAGFLIMWVGIAIAHAATVKAVAAVHLGRVTTIAESYRSLKGKIWRVLLIFLLVAILSTLAAMAVIILAVVVGSLAFTGMAQAGRLGTVLGGLVTLGVAIVGGILALAVYVRYALSIAACVVEDQRVIASLKRSSFLSKGSRGRILAVYMVFGFLGVVFAIVLGGLVGALGTLIPSLIVRLILNYITGFVAGSLTGPLATIGIALIYYDERVRKEAFDIHLMMASLETPLPASPMMDPAQP